MIRITINSKEIELENPLTVLEAARSAGIKIPTLCYFPGLKLYGGCRLCLVEVDKMPKLQTSCTLTVTDGMVVRTESEEITKARRAMLEFLLINHPLDCPQCDKAGECDLQDLVQQYGPSTGRFKESKRKHPESFKDPVIVRNMERCIVCTRCVRMCEGVQGASAIAVTGRGGHSFIEPFSGGRYNCEYCGNCLTVCPVGAIMSRLHRHAYRPWQITDEIATICPYCGVGCSVKVQVREDEIKRVLPIAGAGVNNGVLCSRGRFGYEFAGSPERLKTPFIRKNGRLEPCTWGEAIEFAAQGLKAIKDKSGGGAIAGIASARCTNEENYIFQKFMRAALNTNNIDSIARTGYAGAQRYLENIFGQGVTANLISGLANSDTVLVLGGDPTTVNPVLGLQIRAAQRNGGNILTIGDVGGLEYFSPISLVPRLYTEDVLLEAVIAEIGRIKGVAAGSSVLESKISEIKTSLDEAGKACGLEKERLSDFAAVLSKASTPAIVLGKELIQRTDGNYFLLLAAALSYLTNARIYLLSDKPNEQGVLDMGCAPDMLPGHRPLAYAEFRKKYDKAWKTTLPVAAGLNIFEMLDSADEGELKAMYIMGENPVFNLPDTKRVKASLEKLDLLVVQDIFMTETAEMADVVFPSVSWAEKEGTFTNMERRVQRLRKALPDAHGREDWKIISMVSKHLGIEMNYSSAEEIMSEVSRVSPLYRELTYEDIGRGGVIYPYKGEPLRGVSDSIEVSRPAKNISGDKVYLAVEVPLFHSGTLSRSSEALNSIQDRAFATLNPETAARLGLKAGEVIRVSTEKGSLKLPLKIEAWVNKSVIALTNNFKGMGAFSLAGYTTDLVTSAPGIEGIEVKIEKEG